MASKILETDNNKVVGVDNKANKIMVNWFKINKSRNSIPMPNIRVTG